MKQLMVIKIKISEQKLYLLEGDKLVKTYPISTSRYGTGNRAESNKTPLGRHRIFSKIGRNAPWGAIFEKRRNTGKRVKKTGAKSDEQKDLITSRILRLEGLEKGVNKGKGIDSFGRCIYIHGTSDEKLIGRPASHGCIRMRNNDIIELFDEVKRNTPVVIAR